MKTKFATPLIGASLWMGVCPLGAQAQADHAHHTPSPVQASAAVASISPWSQGVVKRIDLSARKITLQHGPIAILGMDPMTMVFQLRDEAAFQAAQSLKVGDKIEFEAAYDKGAYLVKQIRFGAAPGH